MVREARRKWDNLQGKPKFTGPGELRWHIGGNVRDTRPHACRSKRRRLTDLDLSLAITRAQRHGRMMQRRRFKRRRNIGLLNGAADTKRDSWMTNIPANNGRRPSKCLVDVEDGLAVGSDSADSAG
jgi:hypothetical protein